MVATWLHVANALMARPKKDSPVDLREVHELTVGVIERLTCPAGKSQAFLRDGKGNGLRVRVTAGGAKSYVFEAKLRGRTIRSTIGDVRTFTIDDARKAARKLQATLDQGEDPRELERQREAEVHAAKLAEAANARRATVTGMSAWNEYIVEGRDVGFTNRGPWGTRHYLDHVAFADPGGIAFKRKKGITAPGPLSGLLSRPLVQLDSAAVERWLRVETPVRPTRTALAFRLLRGFLNWCGEHPVYSTIAQAGAHRPKTVRRLVRRQAPKMDTLQREQLKAWFEAVRADPDPCCAAYLQALLLTGARKGEIAGMRWTDIEFRFGGSLTIRDKVDGQRVIPCPPHLAKMLDALPRNCEWVFGHRGPRIAQNVTYNHRRALAAASLPHVTLHGLRRAFGTLSEWVECPAGVVAQLQGHKPSATAEKHYRARPLDLLRVWHEKIENWILVEAGIAQSLRPASQGEFTRSAVPVIASSSSTTHSTPDGITSRGDRSGGPSAQLR
jgi:integrase